MFDLLLTDCRLATMEENGTAYGAIDDGAIGITEEDIAWIGSARDLPHRQARRHLPLAGRWVTPGLIDCHSHFIYAGQRVGDFEARTNGASYAEIAQAGGGIRSTMRATRAASEEELLANALRRLRPFLEEGLTTLEIKSGYGLTLADEEKCLRVATLLGEKTGLDIQRTCLAAHAFPPEFPDRTSYVAAIAEEWLPALVKKDLIDAVDGFCEHIAFTPAEIDRLFAAARALGLPVKLHADQLSGMGASALAARHRALSADHLEYARQKDIVALAEAGTVAVLLPGAYYFLREPRKPPVALLRRHGVPIAVGSDHNPGTSPLTSLLPALNLAVILLDLTPEEALRGVTCHAARALGKHARIGTLRAGMQADLAVWDIAEPGELSYWIGGGRCHLRIKKGKSDDAALA
ncbi:MAG TPA: imidazolonepropionase [Dongiaceae bacterium]|jgi:imidazolonepropionase|nr:imidazolonepropionase [Dongiaceae bacterium]